MGLNSRQPVWDVNCYLNTSQIDTALRRAGYCDNKLSAVNFVGRRLAGSNDLVVDDYDVTVPADAEYVYEICFYDDNIGHLALGYVFVARKADGLHAEPGVRTVDLTTEGA